jgi:hypothetical protein
LDSKGWHAHEPACLAFWRKSSAIDKHCRKQLPSKTQFQPIVLIWLGKRDLSTAC